MKYTVYCRYNPSDEDDGENVVDFYDHLIRTDWYLIDSNISKSEVISILDSYSLSDRYDEDTGEEIVFVVLPDIAVGNKVMNIKSEEIGEVIHFDENPLRTFEDDYVEIECLYDFVVVKKEGTEDIVTWKVNDLIVI